MPGTTFEREWLVHLVDGGNAANQFAASSPVTSRLRYDHGAVILPCVSRRSGSATARCARGLSLVVTTFLPNNDHPIRFIDNQVADVSIGLTAPAYIMFHDNGQRWTQGDYLSIDLIAIMIRFANLAGVVDFFDVKESVRES
jgi:hypothetical protein